MRALRILSLAALKLPLCALGCSGGSDAVPSSSGGGGEGAGIESVGEVSAAITSVPASVGCVDLQASSGELVVDRKFDVFAGETAVLTMQGLPLGTVVFNGLAYAGTCEALTASSIADYATDPVPATLSPGVLGNVQMTFHAAGGTTVGITFDDGGVPSSLAITPSAVSFATLFCGATPQSQTLSVKNTTANPMTVSAAPSTGAPLAVSPTSASIAPGASASFVVSETRIASPYPVGALHASVTFTTSIVFDPPHVVPVPLFVGSAVFQFSQPELLEPGTITLSNTGNEAASFSLARSPSSSTVTFSPSSGTVSPGGSVSIAVGESPVNPFAVSTISLSSPNELCQPAPSFTYFQ